MQIFGPLAYGVRVSSKASVTAASTLSARVDWGQDSLYYMPSRRCWVDWDGTVCATCQVVAGWIEVRTFCATCQIVAGWIGVGHFVLLDQLVAGWIGVRTVCATHQVLQLPKVLRSIQFLYGASRLWPMTMSRKEMKLVGTEQAVKMIKIATFLALQPCFTSSSTRYFILHTVRYVKIKITSQWYSHHFLPLEHKFLPAKYRVDFALSLGFKFIHSPHSFSFRMSNAFNR